MSRMNELSIAIDELRNAAAALNSGRNGTQAHHQRRSPCRAGRQERSGLRSAGTRTAQTIRRGTALRGKPGRLRGSAS